jgi:phage protein D
MPPTDRSAPGVRLTLFQDEKASVGVPLDLGTRLLSFAFEDTEEKADKLSLELDNHDLALFDREELTGGAVLEVSWGYPGYLSPPRRVVLKSLKGFQVLKVEGQALSALMNQQQKTRRWEKKTRAEVVRKLARENGNDGAFADV